MVTRVSSQTNDQPQEAPALSNEQIAAGVTTHTNSRGNPVTRLRSNAAGEIVGAKTISGASMDRTAEAVAQRSVAPVSQKLVNEIHTLDDQMDSLAQEMGTISPYDPVYQGMQSQMNKLQAQRADKQTAFDYETARRSEQVAMAREANEIELREQQEAANIRAQQEANAAFKKKYGVERPNLGIS